MSAAVTITEVGLRDGLQSLSDVLPVEDKITFANRLISAGVRRLEATSFVSPRAVPQLADAEELVAGIDRVEGLVVEALVPNQRGGERAAGVDVWVAFMSVSETHSQANSNCSVDEAFARIRPLPVMAGEVGATVTAALALLAGHRALAGHVAGLAAVITRRSSSAATATAATATPDADERNALHAAWMPLISVVG